MTKLFLFLLAFSISVICSDLKGLIKSSIVQNIMEKMKIDPPAPGERYPDDIIDRASNLAISDYLLSCQFITDASIGKEDCLKNSLDLIKQTMGFKSDDFQGQLVERMMKNLIYFSIRHTLTIDSCTDPSKKKAETKLAEGTGKRITIFVHECILGKYFEIPEKAAIILLEFIYKFAPDGSYYRTSFSQLFRLISCEGKQRVFESFIRYFNPNRQALPDFSSEVARNPEVAESYSSFLMSFHHTIESAINYDSQRELYYRHMCAILINILSNSMFDINFVDILSRTLPRIDPLYLVTSDRFILVLTENINKIPASETALLQVFFDIFLTEATIERISSHDFTRFGGFIRKLQTKFEALVSARLATLSEASKTKIQDMLKVYDVYDVLALRAESIKYLKSTFFEYTQNNLIEFSYSLFELANSYQMMMRVSPNLITSCVADAGLVLLELVKSQNNDDPSTLHLNFYRFNAYLGLLALTIKNSIILVNSKSAFIRVIQFFNAKVLYNSEILDMATHIALIRSIISQMIKSGVFFDNSTEFQCILDFFTTVLDSHSAVAEVSIIFAEMLKQSSDPVKMAKIINTICDDLKMESGPIILSMIVERSDDLIRKYNIFSTKSLLEEDFINELINFLIFKNQLSRTEKKILLEIQSFLLNN
jgi:hypothetical protein